MKKLKILHVWDIAGMNIGLAKYQTRQGHISKSVYRKSFNIHNKKYDYLFRGNALIFYLCVIFLSLRFNIIHLNAVDKLVPILRFIYPRKKIIITYHGSEIRRLGKEKSKYWKKAHLVSVTTPDLLDEVPNCILTPCPIDTELNQRKESFIPKSALFLWYHHSPLAMEIVSLEAKRMGLNLIVQDITQTRFLEKNFPRFLEAFEYYFDVKELFGRINPAMSNTGFQALSLGLKVFCMGKWVEQFPFEIDTKFQSLLWTGRYKRLLNGCDVNK